MTFNQLYDLHLLNPYRFWLSDKSDKSYRKVKSSRSAIFQSQPIVNFGWYRTGIYFRENGFNDFSLHEHKYLFNWDLEIKDGGEYLDYSDKHIVYIHTSLTICWMPKIEFTIGFNRYSFWPRSNKEINKDSIREMVFKYINNTVYYPENTNYGAIQRLYCIKKEQLVAYLKRNKIRKDRWAYSESRNSDAIKAIKRKYGYFTSEWADSRDFVKTASNLFKERGKGKNKEVARFRLETSYEFDGNIDELEEALNEQWMEQERENLILI